MHPEQFLNPLLESKYSRYERLINDLLDVFGPERLVTRPYQRGMDVVADFLNLIDLQAWSNPGDLSLENISLSPAQLELLRRTHAADPDPALRWQGRWFFERLMVQESQSQHFSVFPEHLQEQLIKLTRSDWPALAKTVRGTRFAEPEVFQALAEDAANANVRPYIGATANQEAIIREASQALATAIPLAWQRRMRIPREQRRFSRFAMAVRSKIVHEPADLLPAMIRVTQRRGLNKP